ncbi:MAG: alpha/beta fold hydrolase [Pseudomonadota bacterium]
MTRATAIGLRITRRGLAAAVAMGVGLPSALRADEGDPDVAKVTAEVFAQCRPAEVVATAGLAETIGIDTPDGRIEGTMVAPQGADPLALVLMLHGYTGARDEQRGMFRRAAERLAARGVASLRIDFIGSGQSDGEWADTRFSTQARDAIRAVAALRAAYPGQDLPLGMLGFSQGGLVALRAAAAGAPVERLALWNPVMDPMATYGIIFGRETILHGAGLADVGETAVIEGTRLRPAFFVELAAADPIADAAATPAEIMVVTGRRDSLVRQGAALAGRLAAAREAEIGRPTRIVSLDAGHDLGAIHAPPVLQAVTDCTAGFLLGLR